MKINTVEKYIIGGTCNGCDQCPICCYNQGYCTYDGPECETYVNDEECKKCTNYKECRGGK